MKSSGFRPTGHRLGAGLAGLTLAISACSGDTGATPSGADEEPGDPVEIVIEPQDGATEVRPDLPLTVTAEGGTITDVTVTADQAGDEDAAAVEAETVTEGETGDESEESELDAITGTLNDDGTQWTNDWTLPPGSEITVTATGESDDGEQVEAISEFTTLAATPGQQLEIQSNFPTSGETVGVGMPVILNFDLPVHNKAQVEAAIEVLSDEPNQGAINWFGDQMAVFRTEEYWQPGEEVTVNVRLAGVRFAEDMYGARNYQINFEVGREQITTVNDDTHRMVVERDGEEIQDFPISNGDATTEAYTTTSGTHLIMEKYAHLVMDSETVGIPPGHPDYYKLDVEWAVRFTNSGMFTHSAPWNQQLGESNESHGCTNMAPEDAKWFYDNSLMGDIFIVEGTDRPLEVDNGWGFWERSWEEWLEHSELGEPQQTDEPGVPDAPPPEGEGAEAAEEGDTE